jgi:hypothetical protein
LTQVNATQAALECLKYGWSLLDLTYGRADVLINLLKECSPSFPVGYVGSFNGLASNCTVVQLIEQEPIEGLAVSLPINEGWCANDANLLPICQVQCPVYTNTGVEPGLLSLTTTTTSVTVTAVQPTTTTTTTTTCTDYYFELGTTTTSVV